MELLKTSWPFDSDPNVTYDDLGYPILDRAVGADTLQRTFDKFFSDGVFSTSDFRISAASGLSVNIQPGMCIINGGMAGWWDDAKVVTLSETKPQWLTHYAIFLRYDNNDDMRGIYLRVDASAAGANVPTPVREANVTELRLGYVTVPANATDLSGATITNEVGTAMTPITTPLFDVDVTVVLEDLKAKADAAYQDYYDLLISAVDGTTAGNLQNQINANSKRISDLSSDINSIPAVTADSVTNAGSGWNAHVFRTPFPDSPSVVAMVHASGYTVEVKDVTATQFLYRVLSSGSATADTVDVMWIATLKNELINAINKIANTGHNTVSAILADEAAFTSLAESEEAMFILYDDASARSAIIGSASLLNIVFDSDAAIAALVDHPLMYDQAMASDMAETKYILHQMGLPAETVDSSDEFVSSSVVLDRLLSSSEARLVLYANDLVATKLAADTAAVTAFVSNETIVDEIANGIGTSVFAASKNAVNVFAADTDLMTTFAAGSGGMAEFAASTTAMSVFVTKKDVMGIFAAEAIALNAICKVSNARTKWMGSSYAQTHYSTVYETLHNAPASLFTKYEDYYSTVHKGDHMSSYPAYTDASGGWSYASSGSTSHSYAKPIAGITLVNYIKPPSACTVYLGSSQTKSNLTSKYYSDSSFDVAYVLMGGASRYCTDSVRYGSADTKFATYVAK